MTLLSVRDLVVNYHTQGGPVPAVRGVDIEIPKSEVLGLAGESGCGKTTIAGALLRLLPRGTEVTGSILLNGEDVLGMRPGRLRAVRWTETSIVFQGAMHALNPVITTIWSRGMRTSMFFKLCWRAPLTSIQRRSLTNS